MITKTTHMENKQHNVISINNMRACTCKGRKSGLYHFDQGTSKAGSIPSYSCVVCEIKYS